MSSENQGRESPPPEQQSDAQQGTMGSGQGVNDDTSNKDTSKSELDDLSSNPTHILDKHVDEKFGKTVENTKS